MIPAAGVGCFFLAVIALHFLQPELNPLTEAVSYYAHGAAGWLLLPGLLSLGGGSLALVPRFTGPGRILLAVWGLSVVVCALFIADPAGSWNRPPSLHGSIHNGGAMIAFLSFPAGATLARREGVLRVLGIACAVATAVFFVSLAPVFWDLPPRLLGLTERIVLGLNALWVLAASRLTRPIP